MKDKLILGLTGTLGSGKGTISKCFSVKKIKHLSISLSDLVREEAKLRNLSTDRETLKMIGNELRNIYGEGVLVQRLNENLKNTDYDLIIIDGIRMPGEVEELRKNSNFNLIGIDSQLETRLLRVKNRAREIEPSSLEEFRKKDYEDRGFEKSGNEQQTEKCLELSDYLIWNEEPFTDIEKSHLSEKIFDAYELFKGIKTRRPSFEEVFMNIAYTWATRSTCLRRKVGAVATINKQQIATGYNGVAKEFEHCKKDGCLREKMNIPSGEQLDICRAVHAEENVINQAAKLGYSINGSTIYITNHPCYTCAKNLTNAGVKEIIYVKYYPSKLSEEHFEYAQRNNLIKIRRFEGVTPNKFHDIFKRI